VSESASRIGAARRFPDGFVWGSATSAYQIEGAVATDGRGESIWDRFCATAGRIADGSSGAIACDHYFRFREDVAMMKHLGLNGYRFSIAWPRVVPTGRGEVNQRGLDFYDRLVDAILGAGIQPFPTLYHWDLPQVLEDRGGWPERATAEAFGEYAAVVAERLGDRITDWMTVNEPYIIAAQGYLTGHHAPGRSSLAASLAASHHVLLAHGLGLAAIKSVAPDARVGLAINFTPVTPIGSSPAALDRQRLTDEFENQWYVDPVGGKGYPEFTVERLGWDQSEVARGDMELIAAPIDVLGVNFYTRQMVGAFGGEQRGRGHNTAMGWEIHPQALGDLLVRLHEEHKFPRILITENGAAMPDRDRADGRVADLDRLDYLAAHLAQVHDAIEAGVPVEGYFAWSLLDNFEWAYGYEHKFGLIEVDTATQRRTPKQSALWYAEVARSGELPPRRFET
jgi:beta-glucosidase